MMIGLFFAFILLLTSLWLGVQLNHDSGYLLITINHWTVETTLVVAVLGLIILFFLLHGLLLFSYKLRCLPHRFHQWRRKMRMQKAQARTQQGFIEFSEGYWSEAKNHLMKAVPASQQPLVNYLTAARAAQEMGDNELRDNYLREAQEAIPDAKIAVELTLAQLQLANKQWEQALITLNHLQTQTPRHPYVLKLLLQLYQEVQDWPQLITLLPELKKNQLLSDLAFEQLSHQTYKHALEDLALSGDPESLDKLVSKLPKFLALDPDLIAIYARFLLEHRQIVRAETILRQALRKNFNEQLINLYGQIKLNEKPLAFAETLLKTQHSAALYLCLGRLSLANQLWGKAKNYFDKSIQLQPTPDAYAEAAKLNEQLGEEQTALQYYCQGLNLALTPKYDHSIGAGGSKNSLPLF